MSIRIHPSVSAAVLTLACLGASTPKQFDPKAQVALGDKFRSASTLNFEPNVGQTDPQVKYVGRRGTSRIFITAHGAVLAETKMTPVGEMRDSLGSFAPAKLKAVTQAIEMSLVGGANPSSIVPSLPQAGVHSYFLGQDRSKWINSVPQYGRVEAKSVYKGVDVVYYGNAGQLEYDFVVKPGADPKQIHLAFAGQDSMRTNSSGDLVLSTALGDFVQRRPKVYQDIAGQRVEVASGYRVDGVQVGFDLARYDASKPLIIDPVLVSSTYLGGSGSDQVSSISSTPFILGTGNNAHPYAAVTGYTASTNFPKSGTSYSGGIDAFLTVLDPDNGTFVQSAYFGGSAFDAGTSVAVDPINNTTCVGGFTFSTNFPLSQYPYEPNGADAAVGGDGFVTCFGYGVGQNLALSPPVASTYIGQGNTLVNAVSFSSDDASQEILYVGGSTVRSLNFRYALAGCYAVNCTGIATDRDAFIGIFQYYEDDSGMFEPIEIGGTGDDVINAIAGGDNGFVAIGSTQSNNVPLTSAIKGSLTGTQNVLIAVYEMRDRNIANGEMEVISYYGSSAGGDIGNAVSKLPYQGIVPQFMGFAVGGSTSAPTWPAVGSLGHATNAGGYDAFVSEIDVQLAINSVMTVNTSTLYGGNGDDSISSLVFGSNSQITAVGTTASSNLPLVSPLTGQTTLKGTQDGFILRYNTQSSTPQFVTYLGGSGSDQINGVAQLDASGSIIVAGVTNSTNFPTLAVGTSPLAATAQGGNDGFVSRIFLSDMNQIVIASQDSIGNSFDGVPVNFLANTCSTPTEATTDTTINCAFAPTVQTAMVSMPTHYVELSGTVDDFVRWTDGSTNPTRTFTPQYSIFTLYSAVYNRQNPLNITTAGTGSGTAVPTSGTLYPLGTTVPITASPASGSAFSGWTGATPQDLALITNPASASTTIYLGRPANITANFTLMPKTNPVITWADPASITFGSALGSAQLNATASVPGTFVYNPAAGTVLTAGAGQTLSVTFTPTDTTLYNVVSAMAHITVTPPATGGLVVTSSLARMGANVIVTVAFANTGATPVANVMLNTVTFGTVTGLGTPATVGSVPAGTVSYVNVTLPNVTTGTAGVLSLAGTYTGGTFKASTRATLP